MAFACAGAAQGEDPYSETEENIGRKNIGRCECSEVCFRQDKTDLVFLIERTQIERRETDPHGGLFPGGRVLSSDTELEPGQAAGI